MNVVSLLTDRDIETVNNTEYEYSRHSQELVCMAVACLSMAERRANLDLPSRYCKVSLGHWKGMHGKKKGGLQGGTTNFSPQILYVTPRT